MPHKSILQCLAFILSVALPSPLLAETIDPRQMEAEMRSDRCPANPAEVVIESKSNRCGGDGTNSPCGSGRTFDQACAAKYETCGDKWLADLSATNAYNAWIAKCKSKRSNDSASTPGRINNFGDRLKDRQNKAAQAPAKAQAYRNQIIQDEAKTSNKRDQGLEALRREAAERERINEENRAAEKVKAETVRKWRACGAEAEQCRMRCGNGWNCTSYCTAEAEGCVARAGGADEEAVQRAKTASYRESNRIRAAYERNVRNAEDAANAANGGADAANAFINGVGIGLNAMRSRPQAPSRRGGGGNCPSGYVRGVCEASK